MQSRCAYCSCRCTHTPVEEAVGRGGGRTSFSLIWLCNQAWRSRLRLLMPSRISAKEALSSLVCVAMKASRDMSGAASTASVSPLWVAQSQRSYSCPAIPSTGACESNTCPNPAVHDREYVLLRMSVSAKSLQSVTSADPPTPFPLGSSQKAALFDDLGSRNIMS